MEQPNEALITLENISKVFYTDEVETHALAGVHLEIQRGEYVSIEGPSGCGKSTLLSILGLLDTPTDGSYRLKGAAVAKLKAPERARIRNREIGFIFQAFNLIGDLTVYENVELPLTYRGMDSANGQAVMDLLSELHSQGATICMVTHDPRYAHCAQRKVHLFDGRIVEEG
jgi:putative ABC transport system ATP-binding protein